MKRTTITPRLHKCCFRGFFAVLFLLALLLSGSGRISFPRPVQISSMIISRDDEDKAWSIQESPHIDKKFRFGWKHSLVLSGIFLLAFVVAYRVRRFESSRISLREKMDLASAETAKLRELDLVRSRYFSNISHEIRTPLTLILSAVEKISESSENKETKHSLSVIDINARRLMELMNQLLDLSKLESGAFQIKVTQGNIIRLIDLLILSFNPLAEQKKIRIRSRKKTALSESQSCDHLYFDMDVMEKILANLLFNAIKFTPTGGWVDICAGIHQSRKRSNFLEIVIKDSGIGIPPEKLPFIYERFYQVDNSPGRKFEGAGIGLAYVRELVGVHKGRIVVMSKEHKGTTVRLRLPVDQQAYTSAELLSAFYTQRKSEAHPTVHETHPCLTEFIEKNTHSQGRHIILIVEDHPEMMRYLRETLKADYITMGASNAVDGLELAQEKIPDLIITDIMMPGMDGYAFCEEIKSNEKTSHIPVIFLTAKTNQTDIIHGLETGADDYLIKPFNTIELKIRVKNMIQSRLTLRKKFTPNTLVKAEEISVTSRDRMFIEKILQLIEENIDNEKFTVELFARSAGMSPSQLHRKLKALTGQSAIQFIRSARMHRAMELLEKNTGNIAETAYKVGFDDPAYFTRTFKAFFGEPPSAIKKKQLNL